jgi:endonuclease/exonuclease/phosphatase family metal-dependent hydrolase
VSETQSLRIATYNVHSCVGTDRRCDPERVGRVVEELRADVVALQEMTYPADLALETRSPVVLPVLGYECALGPTHTRKSQRFGNVVLTRFPIRDLARIDLSTHRREPRAALHVVLDAYGTELHVIATHLGLGMAERRVQVARIAQLVRELAVEFFVVVGDFNDWLPGRSLVHTLDDMLGTAGSPRSFPSRWPLLALDRVWVHPRERVRSIHAHQSPLARRASDHLPVVAELELRAVLAGGKALNAEPRSA